MSLEAMKQALEALELHGQQYPHMVKGYCLDAITSLRQAIAEAEKQNNDVYIMGNYAGKGKVSSVTLGGVSFAGNGTAGREADVKPTGFFFQMPEAKKQDNGDYLHQENDGCPIELSVLQRFWRGQDIPIEYQPSWFKQEPVAWVSSVAEAGDKGVRVRWVGGFPQIGDRLYTSPPQRQPLTDEQINTIWHNSNPTNFETRSFARAIEAAHGIKGEA